MRLLRVYPRPWRERYETEMLALLEQHDVSLATRLDLLRGALDSWLYYGRYLMRPVNSPVWRGALLGLIPSAFILAQFLLSLDRSMWGTPVLGPVGAASIPAAFVVCLGAGTWEVRRGGRPRDSLIAGAAAGIAVIAAQIVVSNGLGLLDLGLGITRSVLELQGVHIRVQDAAGQAPTVATVAARMFNPGELLGDVVSMIACGMLGAVIGGLAPALNMLGRRLAV